jgi:hypothetical protein
VLAKKVEGEREQPSLAAKGTFQAFPIRWNSYCVHLRFRHNTTGKIAMAVLVDVCLTTLLIAQTVHFGRSSGFRNTTFHCKGCRKCNSETSMRPSRDLTRKRKGTHAAI